MAFAVRIPVRVKASIQASLHSRRAAVLEILVDACEEPTLPSEPKV
jgi:hypothetical protein